MPLQERAFTGTVIGSDGVDFHLPVDADIDGVRLEVDFSLGPTDPEFRRRGDHWSLHLPRPALDRLEYQFTVRSGDRTSWMTDPGNPATVPNPFGEKSEIRFPGYREPSWLNTPVSGDLQPVPTGQGLLDCPVPVTLWSPDALDPTTAAPLLLVHDGSDMADRGSLLRWASHAASERRFRIALLDPAAGCRDKWYAASDDYADHLANVVLPVVRDTAAIGPTIGLGASLGALSMLSIQRRHPDLLAALFLQSGSFFTQVLDPQEDGYGFFGQICRAVQDLAAGPASRQGPVLITCGAVEENRSNNELMAKVLAGQHYQVELHLLPDAHTMIGWRDAWSPGLERLLDGLEPEVLEPEGKAR